MRVTSPDGVAYEVARHWAGTSLGRLLRRWSKRVSQWVRFRRLGDAMDVGDAADVAGLFGEVHPVLAGWR